MVAPTKPSYPPPLGLALCCWLLLCLASGSWASPKLGALLPVPINHAHPDLLVWPNALPVSGRYLLVIYSHDCGALGDVQALLASGLPIYAVQADAPATAAPKWLSSPLLSGDAATAWSRALKISSYPSVLMIHQQRIRDLWEAEDISAFPNHL